ncbi:MAG: enoyl-CoA hydratase/isomerase family protein [Planctomycetota bacterium]|jgi:enoyl-CoA hydratase|nr:enoyl-CoA hydratase/isomerase family protein [Planctomycetota bacterium]
MGKVFYKADGHVGTVVVRRPEALNALDAEMIHELSALLDEIAGSEIRCLIVTGDGDKSFVAGADVTEMAELNPEGAAELCRNGNAVMLALETLPMPVIAAVNGFALGGGFELALSCDIRLAAANASFALPEVSLGVIPGYGGIQRLARIIGPGAARELVFTGRRIKADEALRLGLVSMVSAAADLRAAAGELAGRIAVNAPLAVRAAKRALNKTLGMSPFDANLGECDEFAACFGTGDQREAMRAFVEKRKPEPFVGA